MRTYFTRLIGNEDTKQRLGRAIESNTLPHAFLISGQSGSGKSTLATELAAALNCIDGHSGMLPCGKCNNCRRIYDGNYPDVKILAKKKDKATLGVEAVKDFREDMFLSSTESENKIYIIDDAECMTPEAQNALLKVLEEPPKAVRIILLATECDRILTTIKSRAQYIAMGRFDDEALAEKLLATSAEARAMKAADEAKFMSLIMSADGRLGLAKALLNKRMSDEIEEERGDILSLIRAVGQKSSYADIHSAISRFPSKRADLLIALERLMSAIRDLTIIKYDPRAKTVFFPSASEAERLCGNISSKRLIALYDAVNEAHVLCMRNANITNIIANLASKIRLATNN
ncbi:MAG: AAA family ATPase [Clostridia bacterium]|nr:AAA family ATPase [Clostridia bacterium]